METQKRSNYKNEEHLLKRQIHKKIDESSFSLYRLETVVFNC